MSVRWYPIIALAIGIAAVRTVFALSASPAQAQQSSTGGDADKLGGVRVVFRDIKNPEDEATRADAVKKAAAKAGWTETRIDRSGTITLLPPPNYTSSMFGELLNAIQKARLKNFGIQLLDSQGRATDDQGRPIE